MEYAGFWRRAAALFIDGLILLIPSAILGSALPVLGSFLCFLAYRPVFESSPLQATPGKALMGLAVINELDGGRISLKTAFVRSLLTFVSGAFFCIGYFMAIFTQKNQTLHDLVAQTVVIRKEAAEVNFFQVWWDEIKKIINYQSPPIDAASSYSTSSPSSSTTSPEASTHTLEELYKLYQTGALTEQEYQAKKEEILKRI